MTVAELVPVLQMAIGPVVLVSGVGLLILSLTNRLGRVVDRGRSLALEMRETAEPKHPNTNEQLRILFHRALLLRRSILSAVLCMLLSSVLVITLFIFAIFNFQAAWFISLLFVGAMGLVILSLVYLLQELNHALKAFRLDIGKQ